MQCHIHLMLGNVLLQQLKNNNNKLLDRQSFLYGNVRPDLQPDFDVDLSTNISTRVEHYPHTSIDYVFNRLSTFLERLNEATISTKDFSLELGHLNHYFCDFFCHAHTEKFDNHILKHYWYESKQAAYMTYSLNNIIKSQKIASGDFFVPIWHIRTFFDTLHQSYLSKPISFKNDIDYAINFCTAMNMSVTSHALLADINTRIA